jgi:transcriptional regulator with XRE-family HTH domain
MGDFGKKIRQKRREKDLTLDQLSKRAKLSKSFLSQIERGLAQPSITTLKRIAHELGISVVSLFVENDERENRLGSPPSEENSKEFRPYVEDVQVVRAHNRKRLALPGSKIVYDLLTPDLNRRLELIYVHIEPGQNSGTKPMLDPPGEKCGLLLKGNLEVRVGNELYRLHQGDTIYHPAHVPHSWRGIGKEPIEVIWVLTPPWF